MVLVRVCVWKGAGREGVGGLWEGGCPHGDRSECSGSRMRLRLLHLRRPGDSERMLSDQRFWTA
jgi:hypothetical protein